MDTLILMSILCVGCFVITHIEKAEAALDASVDVIMGIATGYSSRHNTQRCATKEAAETVIVGWFRENYIPLDDVKAVKFNHDCVVYTATLDGVTHTASIKEP